MFVDACVFCNQSAEYHPFGALNDRFQCKCPNCSNYFISTRFKHFVAGTLTKTERAKISGYIKESNEFLEISVTISEQNYSDILNSPIIANSISEKLKKLILFVYRKTNGLGDKVTISSIAEYSICYAISEDEFQYILDVATKKGYIDFYQTSLWLTFDGHVYAESISKESIVSSSVFVAMWFSPEVQFIYEAAIKAAIESKECGSFKAFRVDNHEHNNDITDEIIAGIKACRFMVADLTGYRGGVYYEAGFAKGLGKPVIFTCRKDWFDGETSPTGEKIKERVHFDINHQNIIVWDNPDDLKQRIINRIRATII